MNISDKDHNRIVNWAKKHQEIKSVYLFGSRARGDNNPDSDIDLAIEMIGVDADEAFNTWCGFHDEFIEKPDLHLNHEVDLEWYAKDANLDRVGPGVEKDGILLYPEERKLFNN